MGQGNCRRDRTAYNTETDELSLVCLDDVHACGYRALLRGLWCNVGLRLSLGIDYAVVIFVVNMES